MATQNVLVLYKTTKEVSDLSFSNWGKYRPLEEAIGGLESLSLGTNSGAVDIQLSPVYAAGWWNVASGSGLVGVTIGGRAVTVTWATSDPVTCDALAAAVNADAVASTYVRAYSRPARATINISGGSGLLSVTFTVPGSSGSAYAQYTASTTWATSDAATATALGAAIMAIPNLGVINSVSAGSIFNYAVPTGGTLDQALSGASNTYGNNILITYSGTGITGPSSFAGAGTGTQVILQALVPGTIGNGLTLATAGAGTGQTVIGSNLVGGLGGPGNLFTA